MTEFIYKEKESQAALLGVSNKEAKTAVDRWRRPRLLKTSNDDKIGPSDGTLVDQEERL